MSDQTTLTALFVVSLAGLAASCALHVAALFGFSPALAHSRVWVLHVIGSLIMLAALLAAWNVVDAFRPKRFANAFRYAPRIYRTLAWILVGYALIAGFGLLAAPRPEAAYLFGHGGVASGLHGATDRWEALFSFRLLTCGWIGSYALASLLLASAKRAAAEQP